MNTYSFCRVDKGQGVRDRNRRNPFYYNSVAQKFQEKMEDN